MSNVPLPEPLGNIFRSAKTRQDRDGRPFSDDQMHAYAAAVTTAKDAEKEPPRAARMAYASEFPFERRWRA